MYSPIKRYTYGRSPFPLKNRTTYNLCKGHASYALHGVITIERKAYLLQPRLVTPPTFRPGAHNIAGYYVTLGGGTYRTSAAHHMDITIRDNKIICLCCKLYRVKFENYNHHTELNSNCLQR